MRNFSGNSTSYCPVSEYLLLRKISEKSNEWILRKLVNELVTHIQTDGWTNRQARKHRTSPAWGSKSLRPIK